jgi:predicted DNA-binding protein (MmcQ/YjbR family)
MNIDEVKIYCRSLAGATEIEHGHPSNILVFQILDKKFAYFKTSQPEQWRFSLRVHPERFLELTDQDGIRPARYMGRFHWVTIVDVAAMPPESLRELITASYQKALVSLNQKQRNELNVT